MNEENIAPSTTQKPIKYDDQPGLDLTKEYWQLETTLETIRAQDVAMLLSFWSTCVLSYDLYIYFKKGIPMNIIKIVPNTVSI